MKEEKFSNNRKPSHSQVSGEFWDLREKHNWKKQTNPRQNTPNCDYQWGNGSEAPSTSSEWGLGREMRAASLVLLVRTGLRCPEDSLRGLT